ncbi:hypothetical protein ANN_23745 [Periplaneta americana]|uniref:Tc1-like transposase DDE domain-containing protein n=1 Tax=Periplaneta americana TaxID=6978 RepID=A0ABQ8SMV4_PERAM|nr:hypothetical protein ANN_23745 [Periplaneta americana]
MAGLCEGGNEPPGSLKASAWHPPGVRNQVFIDGEMDEHKFIGVLRDILSNSVHKLGLDEVFRFQQHNDPKHITVKTTEWLVYNSSIRLLTPPQSPDLNPIEYLWQYLGRERAKRHPSNKGD